MKQLVILTCLFLNTACTQTLWHNALAPGPEFSQIKGILFVDNRPTAVVLEFREDGLDNPFRLLPIAPDSRSTKILQYHGNATDIDQILATVSLDQLEDIQTMQFESFDFGQLSEQRLTPLVPSTQKSTSKPRAVLVTSEISYENLSEKMYVFALDADNQFIPFSPTNRQIPKDARVFLFPGTATLHPAKRTLRIVTAAALTPATFVLDLPIFPLAFFVDWSQVH